MPQNIGQLTYTVFNPQADPGTIADFKLNAFDTFAAAEQINPGRFVEMATDNISVQQPQQTSSTFNPVGVALLKRARPGAGAQGVTAYGVGSVIFQPGEYLPVLLQGRVFAEWDPASTQTAWGRPNVYHSSTTATNRGKVTFAATSTTAGSEIAQAPSTVKLRQALSNTGNIALIDVNLPGA